jgi:hypothetical protein
VCVLECDVECVVVVCGFIEQSGLIGSGLGGYLFGQHVGMVSRQSLKSESRTYGKTEKIKGELQEKNMRR